MITDIMIDVETTGKNKGCRIIQIAALPFNVTTGRTFMLKSFKMAINSLKQKSYGLKNDPETIKWWKDTNINLFNKLAKSTNEPITVAKKFKEWFLGLPNSENIRVWGNSPRFDCIILEGFYEKILKEKPFWNTFNERDTRTIASLAPEIKKNMKFEGTKHDALADCNHQINYVVEILKRFDLKVQ